MSFLNYIPDIIMFLIAAVTIFFAAKNGFVRTLVSTLSIVIALVVVWTCTAPLADLLNKTGVAVSAQERIAAKMYTPSDADEEKTDFDALDEMPEGDELDSALEAADMDKKELTDWIKGQEFSSLKEYRQGLSVYIASRVTLLVCKAIAVLLLFVGSRIGLRLLAGILTKLIEKIPIIRKVNTLAGLILGIVLAVFRVGLFVLLMKVIFGSGIATVPPFSLFDPENTILLRFFL